MGNGNGMKMGMRIGTGNMWEKLHSGNQMVLEYTKILKETDMKVNGGVGDGMVREYTLIPMKEK